jgi:hypothetical protein
MLGPRAAGELAGRGSGSRALVAAGAARGSAVEDGFAALQAASGRDGCIWIHRRRGVDRAGSGLGHNHAAGGQCTGGRWGLRVSLGATRRTTRRSGRGFGCNRGDCLFSNRSGCFGGRRGCNGSGLSRSGSGGCRLLDVRLVFALGRSCGRSGERLDDCCDRGRSNHDYRTMRGGSACRSLGDHRTGGRLGGNGRRSWRRGDGRRRGARLRNNFARGRTSRGCGWRRGG